MKKFTLSEMMRIALLAAIISILGYVKVPLPFSPVPITGQTLGVLLAGFVLSPLAAASAVGIFILLGCVGAPVFAGGASGIQVVVGPTGGYLIGFVLAAFVLALLKGNGEQFSRNIVAGLIAGLGVVYAIGVPWLAMTTGMSFQKAFAVGVLPYLIGDVIKIVIAASLGRRVTMSLKHSQRVS